jgi:hypothetical protein
MKARFEAGMRLMSTFDPIVSEKERVRVAQIASIMRTAPTMVVPVISSRTAVTSDGERV